MGIKSVMNTDRLFWLGRYSERVYTTLKLFSLSFDSLIEQSVDDHRAFCESLEIPDIYRDKDDFDNAIELREEIGSETLSFIQMAIYEMKSAKRSEAPMLHFQKITDAILAFWGCADDQIDDENTRNIIKIGKRVERIDLYARLRRDRTDIQRDIRRLSWRICRTDLIYSHEGLQRLKELADAPELDYAEIIRTVDALVEC